MKAFLLAAGRGTRLLPYTKTTPKCLMPINGRPLLAIWLELLAQHGIDHVLINTHHHARQVIQFIKEIKDAYPLDITLVHEKMLLGSGGTLSANRRFVENSGDFVIAYADNLTAVNLTAMVRFHRRLTPNGCVLTMGLMHSPNPTACGIAVVDHTNKIIKFSEKPAHPESNLANAGIFIASQKFFACMPNHSMVSNSHPYDLGFHLLPTLAGKMYGYRILEYIKDIGTVKSYHQALTEWRPTD
jgi:mannose-1-phosphate guanylyltransferase